LFETWKRKSDLMDGLSVAYSITHQFLVQVSFQLQPG
jgi:hypothetical protein